MPAERLPAPASEAQLMMEQTVYEYCGCTELITKQIIRRALEAIKLFDRKQRAYGLKNVSEGGELALANCTNEKIKRLQNLLSLRAVRKVTKKEGCPRSGDSIHHCDSSCDYAEQSELVLQSPDDNGESRRDSWIDIGVQGLIGVMLFDGDWPGAKKYRLVEL